MLISIYNLKEVYESIKQHKVRNLITGFGIAWGVFILILLLGAGNGVKKGVSKLFSSYARNSLWIYGGQTSYSTSTYSEGKNIIFNNEFLNTLKNHFVEIQAVSAEIDLQQGLIASNKENNTIVSIKGVQNDYFKIKLVKLSQGRTFNQIDIRSNRPVCIISKKIKNLLFKADENCIGKYILISDDWFQVIGVLDNSNIWAQNDYNSCFIPLSSFQNSYSKNDNFNVFGILFNDKINSTSFEHRLSNYLAYKFKFAQLDKKALFIMNFSEQVESFNKLFNGLNLFVWGIGICLLLNGIIGISNMMLIIVKERTKEIGIRKAIGATPKNIINMIMTEAIIVTVIAGLVGLFFGIIVIYLFNFIFESNFKDNKSIIDSLEVNIPIVLGAIFVLIMAGTLAGLIPAKKAAEISPIAALNLEN
jgi:putative ABC transport system permease protein